MDLNLWGIPLEQIGPFLENACSKQVRIEDLGFNEKKLIEVSIQKHVIFLSVYQANNVANDSWRQLCLPKKWNAFLVYRLRLANVSNRQLQRSCEHQKKMREARNLKLKKKIQESSLLVEQPSYKHP